MGNSNSNVSSGVKNQADSRQNSVLKMVDLQGGGEFTELMRKATRTKDYREIDERIEKDVRPFLYNGGMGKMVQVQDLIIRRAKSKGKTLFLKSGKSKKNEFDLDDMDEDGNYVKKIDTAEQYKFVCWDLDKRGPVGEHILHLCLLNASSVHADLAKRILRIFPKLINDIYQSDEFYGENVLHIAIVNEDPAMVKFLLDKGVDYKERACGNFFSAEDQKTSRTDTLQHEWPQVSKQTNYEGYTYWGDFPLSFAACLGQEECVRLLAAKGADPNAQDANGNTALHMLVVHDKKEMFDLIHDLGGKLTIKNRQGLTPLTLAAKLARKDMYEHILEIERAVFWIFGNVTCAAYPLEDIDTIKSSTGEINPHSALYQIVYGEEDGHLDMMEGVVSHLLHEKWKTFVRSRFYRRAIAFTVYFAIFVFAFILRPGTDIQPVHLLKNTTKDGKVVLINETLKDPCYLNRVRKMDDQVRFVLEALTVFGATTYIFLAIKEIYHQGFRIFWATLSTAPTKCLHLMACHFVILMVPGRASCAYVYEDIMGVLAILCTAPYFLFFCRGFRIVGPFVVMIYKMIKGDLLRFFTIYLVFLVGFSQSMYIIFLGVKETVYSNPGDALLGMFVMSLGEFADIYETFNATRHSTLAKFVFFVYMVLVTLLLVNMLIAMMGNTYQVVSETQKEWLRQWAKIILVVEQTVTTDERRKMQIKYSQNMDDGRRALAIRWHQTESERISTVKYRRRVNLDQFKRMKGKQQGKKQRVRKLNSMISYNSQGVSLQSRGLSAEY